MWEDATVRHGEIPTPASIRPAAAPAEPAPPTPALEPEIREECGVFGVWAPGEEVSRLCYFGLYALQHRGQESAGIATTDGSSIRVYKDLGLVSQVFDDSVLTNLSTSATPPPARPRGRTPSRCSAPSPAPPSP